MKDKDAIAGFIAVTIVLMIVLAISLGITLLLAYLTQLVVGGFGYTIPFWPTAGAVFLFMVAARMLSSRK